MSEHVTVHNKQCKHVMHILVGPLLHLFYCIHFLVIWCVYYIYIYICTHTCTHMHTHTYTHTYSISCMYLPLHPRSGSMTFPCRHWPQSQMATLALTVQNSHPVGHAVDTQYILLCQLCQKKSTSSRLSLIFTFFITQKKS